MKAARRLGSRRRRMANSIQMVRSQMLDDVGWVSRGLSFGNIGTRDAVVVFHGVRKSFCTVDSKGLAPLAFRTQ